MPPAGPFLASPVFMTIAPLDPDESSVADPVLNVSCPEDASPSLLDPAGADAITKVLRKEKEDKRYKELVSWNENDEGEIVSGTIKQAKGHNNLQTAPDDPCLDWPEMRPNDPPYPLNDVPKFKVRIVIAKDSCKHKDGLLV